MFAVCLAIRHTDALKPKFGLVFSLQNKMPKYYAVSVGRKPGVYTNWKECEDQVKKYSGSIYKSFSTYGEAKKYLGNGSSPKKEIPVEVTEETDEKSFLSTPLKQLSEEEMSSRKYITVFTDGSCLNNGSDSRETRAGIGVFFGHGDPRNLSEPFCLGKATNQRAEIYAVIRALQTLDSEQDVEIVTDSNYVIQAMTSWVNDWVTNGWRSKSKNKEIQNEDLFKQLFLILKRRSGHVKFKHILGHTGEYGNTEADALAVEGAKSLLKTIQVLHSSSTEK